MISTAAKCSAVYGWGQVSLAAKALKHPLLLLPTLSPLTSHVQGNRQMRYVSQVTIESSSICTLYYQVQRSYLADKLMVVGMLDI